MKRNEASWMPHSGPRRISFPLLTALLSVCLSVPRLTLMDLIIILIFSPEMHPSSVGPNTKRRREETDALWIAIIEVAVVE